MPLKAYVAAPGATNYGRLTATPPGEGFDRMCECTEPVGTGAGAVCIEPGPPKWRITMFNDAHTHADLQIHNEAREARRAKFFFLVFPWQKRHLHNGSCQACRVPFLYVLCMCVCVHQHRKKGTYVDRAQRTQHQCPSRWALCSHKY